MGVAAPGRIVEGASLDHVSHQLSQVSSQTQSPSDPGAPGGVGAPRRGCEERIQEGEPLGEGAVSAKPPVA